MGETCHAEAAAGGTIGAGEEAVGFEESITGQLKETRIVSGKHA